AVLDLSANLRPLFRSGFVDPFAVVCSFTDVTESRRAARAVKEAEHRFRGAFDHAPIGMAMVALDGGFLRVNEALTDILGRARQDLEGMHVATVWPAEDLDQDLAAFREM